MCHANVVHFFKTQPAHSGRPGVGGPGGPHPEPCGRAGELQGPFRPRESGRARGAVARPPNPSRTRRRSRTLNRLPARLRPCARAAGARAGAVPTEGGRRGCCGRAEQRGSRASARPSRSHASSPAPRAAEPGRAEMVTAGPRGAGPAAFPAAPRPSRPVFPAAPGHAAPRAGAGFSPAWPPARPTPVRHAAHWSGLRAASP